MPSKLIKHRKIWNKKKILRSVYTEWYKQIQNDLKPGKTVEIGSGTGNFKQFLPGIISSDVTPCSWLDMCFNAEHMPFKGKSISNIVMIDVLHHLGNPLLFLKEAGRVLEKGGRIIMVEPYPSAFSLVIYRKFHPEPFKMNTNPFTRIRHLQKNPWQANQALPYLLFFKYKKKLMQIIGKDFKVIKSQKNNCLIYPLSGGFENKSLVPDLLIPLLKILEIIIRPISFLLAFRCYVILEKT